MAGRRRARAASTSTVATVDEESIKYQNESAVLKPVDASIAANSNEWPCFLLTDATAYNKDGAMANLLHVDLEGPFMIRGKVEIDSDQTDRLIKGKNKFKPTWIEIPRSVQYSIGQTTETAMPLLWTSGAAGWYEIVPSDRYRPIYNTMMSGITLHYGLDDQYDKELEAMKRSEKDKKKRRNLRITDVSTPVPEILFRYTVTAGDGATQGEVVQRCKDQAPFLLAKTELKGTKFYDWLSSTFPEIVQRLAKGPDPVAAQPIKAEPPKIEVLPIRSNTSSTAVDLKGKGKAAAMRNSVQRSTRSSEQAEPEVSDALEDVSASKRSKVTRGKRKSPADSKLDRSEPADVDMHDFAPNGASKADRKNLTAVAPAAAPPAPATEPKAGFPTALAIVEEERVRLLAESDGAGGKRHPDAYKHTRWSNALYMGCRVKEYRAGAEIVLYYASDFTRKLGREWHNSEFYKWVKENAKTKPTFDYISEAEILNLSRRQKMPQTLHREAGRAADKTRSPAIAEHGGKQPPRTPGRPSGKAAGLRPSVEPRKRPREVEVDDDEMELDDYDGVPRRKTARTSQFFADDDDAEQLHDITSSSDEELHDGMEPPKRIVIRAERLPSATPKGPNQTWTCQEPDCEYVVRNADEDEGQALITKHFEEHEKETSDEAKERQLTQLNLAMQEGARGHLPINHLLQKIRQASSKAPKPSGETINGRTVPPPIKRSLFV